MELERTNVCEYNIFVGEMWSDGFYQEENSPETTGSLLLLPLGFLLKQRRGLGTVLLWLRAAIDGRH